MSCHMCKSIVWLVSVLLALICIGQSSDFVLSLLFQFHAKQTRSAHHTCVSISNRNFLNIAQFQAETNKKNEQFRLRSVQGDRDIYIDCK